MPNDPERDPSLTVDEAEALRALRQPTAPPAGLYRSVAAGLRARGSFRPRGRRTAAAIAIAAAITLAFLAGLRAGRPAASQHSPAFAMFLLNSPPVSRPSGVTAEQVVEEYRSWARSLGRDGRLAFAEELAPRRYLVDSAGSRATGLSDGIDGLFVVRASDADAALALARTLPHVRMGGVVAVQPIMSR